MKPQQQEKKPLSYYKRLTLNFERVVIKSENRQLIEKVREDLEIDMTLWTPMTGKRLKLFAESATKTEFKDLVDPKIFYLLQKMDLEFYYYRPMLLYLFSGEKPANLWFFDTAVAYVVEAGQSKKVDPNQLINLANSDIDEYYPVIVKIAGHASQDEVCNFIRENWGKIKEVQSKHGKRYLREVKDLDLYYKGDKLKKEGNSFADIMDILQDDPRIKKLDTNDDLAKKISKGRKFLK
jgi:predicted CopG family antitoxin